MTATEPPQTAERTYTYRAANVPLPAVEEAYHIPALPPRLGRARGARDAARRGPLLAPLHPLVYGKQLASSAYASADLREQPGLFGVR